MSAICTLKDVYRTFEEHGRATSVLRSVNFEIERGEFLCIMGPSGSGKTTLLQLISGLDRPSAGDVVLDGNRLEKMSAHDVTLLRRRCVAHVFQFFNLMPNLTVFENVGLPLAISGTAPEKCVDKINGLLDRLQLTGRADARPHQLSGGEMQRASIARALVGEQPFLLCDEPTGNLSQKAGLGVMEHLKSISNDGQKTILLVTHNPRDAAFADRVLFLVDGELAETELRGSDLVVEKIHETLAELGI